MCQWEFSGGPVLRNLSFTVEGPVQSSVGELRSQVPRGVDKKKTEKVGGFGGNKGCVAQSVGAWEVEDEPMEEQPGTGYWSMNWVTRFIYTRVSPPLG